MNKDTGRFAFLRQLLADGVDTIFGNPGTSEQNILGALADPEFAGIKYYLGLQEGSVVAMGDSYARARRRPAIVQLHSYAGLANGLGMMYYARRGYTPMVVFAGEAGVKYDALDGQMAADLVNIARPFVKSDHNGPCAWRTVDANSVVRLLRRALKTAATPPCGPVFLALPVDVLDLPNTEEIVASLPVNCHVSPDSELLHTAAALLAGAKNPLILFGDGIAASDAQRELTAVAELLGAPAYGVNDSEINFPATHPLSGGTTGHMFGSASKPITEAADVVLVCGTTLMPEVFPEVRTIFQKGARVIHFDLNAYEIGKNFPTAIAGLADPKHALQGLEARLQDLLKDGARDLARERMSAARIAKEKKAAAKNSSDEATFTETPLKIPYFLKTLAMAVKRTGRTFAVFDEALTYSGDLTHYLPCDAPGSYFATRVGMLGTGLPGTVGLKIAYPDHLVIGFAGDGGAMQTIQALATAARHGLGAKFVVLNNRSYRILKYNIRQYWQQIGEPAGQPFPESFGLTHPELNFAGLAKAQGVEAIRVQTPGEVEPAIQRALADDQPFLIELILSDDL